MKSMSRRSFLKGMGAAAVVAATPMVAMSDRKGPARAGYEHKTYATGYAYDKDGNDVYADVGQRYAEALARSMRQTYEQAMADVLNQAFSRGSYQGKSLTMLLDSNLLVSTPCLAGCPIS